MEHVDAQRKLFEQPLNDDAVICFVSNEIPRMTEAQLAELLTNLFLNGPGVIATALVPLARTELERWQAHAEQMSSST